MTRDRNEPRLMTGSEAAAYLGIAAATFSNWVTSDRAPKPLPGTRRWDKKALDLLLDKLSGIETPSVVSEEDVFTTWEAKYVAQKTAARSGER